MKTLVWWILHSITHKVQQVQDLFDFGHWTNVGIEEALLYLLRCNITYLDRDMILFIIFFKLISPALSKVSSLCWTGLFKVFSKKRRRAKGRAGKYSPCWPLGWYWSGLSPESGWQGRSPSFILGVSFLSARSKSIQTLFSSTFKTMQPLHLSDTFTIMQADLHQIHLNMKFAKRAFVRMISSVVFLDDMKNQLAFQRKQKATSGKINLTDYSYRKIFIYPFYQEHHKCFYVDLHLPC